MKVAVLGCGYAGLSAALHLLEKGVKVDLYDPKKRLSASEVSTGFLHPYVGKFPRKPKQADEWMYEATSLIVSIEKAYGKPLIAAKGIFRPALFSAQEMHFLRLSKKDHSIRFLTKEESQKEGFSSFYPGLWMEEGMQVYSKRYVDALLQILIRKGAQFFASTLDDTGNYAAIIEAMGGDSKEGYIKKNKGQTLKIKADHIPFHIPFLSHPHLSKTEEKDVYLIGSTYEKTYQNIEPDSSADQLLIDLRKQTKSNSSSSWDIVGREAAFRAYPLEQKEPLIEKISQKKWLFTGLGSKGLLFHAYFGRLLASKVTADLALHSERGSKVQR
mgnify:CR=1 FL=1